MRIAACLVLILAGCGDDDDAECGVFEAPTAPVTVTAGDTSAQVTAFTSSENNDCPGEGPEVSLTIEAAGDEVTLVLCVPNPGRIGAGAIDLSAHPGTETDRVELVNLVMADGDCTVGATAGAEPTGTATFAGFCAESGVEYALGLEGSVEGVRRCQTAGAPPVDTPVTITLSGAAVATPN